MFAIDALPLQHLSWNGIVCKAECETRMDNFITCCSCRLSLKQNKKFELL
jgi:hypothetical protein